MFGLDLLITESLRALIPLNQFSLDIFAFVGPFFNVFLLYSFLFFLFIKREFKKRLIVFLAVSLFSVLISEFFLKPIFARVRPEVALPLNNLLEYSCKAGYSFPSTHATFVFAASVLLAFFEKKYAFLFYLLAAFIAYSRIFLGCHYFSDVVIGAFIGVVLGFLGYFFLYRRILSGHRGT